MQLELTQGPHRCGRYHCNTHVSQSPMQTIEHSFQLLPHSCPDLLDGQESGQDYSSARLQCESLAQTDFVDHALKILGCNGRAKLVRKAFLHILIASHLLKESTYLEKRFRIRPLGVVSKNDIGLRKMAYAILSCSFRDACNHSPQSVIVYRTCTLVKRPFLPASHNPRTCSKPLSTAAGILHAHRRTR